MTDPEDIRSGVVPPSRRRGYTLIELAIGFSIILIVAAIAIPNLFKARMTADEVAAIASCRTYAGAQEIYRRSDYDGNGVFEFAQHLRGNWSLYECKAGEGDLELIDRAFAFAEGDPLVTVAKCGYVFKVLTSQGPDAPGGESSYIDSLTGRMVFNYGLCAVPTQYNISGIADKTVDIAGVSTYIINRRYQVYQKDRGNDTASHVDVYNPDSTWSVAE